MKKLIILGNGFDLHSNLKSSFNDFFVASEVNAVEKWLNSERKTDNLKEVSFVSLLLYNSYYRKDLKYEDFELRVHDVHFNETFQKAFELEKNMVDWMDIENFLYSILNSNGLSKLVRCFDHCFAKRYPDLKFCFCDFDGIPAFINVCLNGKGYFSVSDFYSFFMEELKLFEKRFICYLKTQLDSNEKYVDESKKILETFCKNDSGVILNFNYTHTNKNDNYEEINVHGSLEDRIIIGIDDRDSLKNEVIPFTKTFRKLLFSEEKVLLNGTYDEIIIYGHSLNEQDYSYFKSIFDYINLYNGKTTIRYIYSDDFVSEDVFNKNRYKHRTKMAMRLFKLIRTYGSSLDNKDSGQNLIHKLILEGRLKLELNNFE